MFTEKQKVWCAVYGAGAVKRIRQEEEEEVDYPVVVVFNRNDDENVITYTADGRFHEAGNVTLFTYPVEIVKAAVKPSIDWDHVHSKFKYLAQDADGSAWLYAEKPQINHSSHWSGVLGGHAKAESHATYDPGTCDWKDSLIERPTGNSGDD